MSRAAACVRREPTCRGFPGSLEAGVREKIDKRLGRQVQLSAGAMTTVDVNVNETKSQPILQKILCGHS